MKAVLFFLYILFTTHAFRKETGYTASTPANGIVRTFLNIDQKDSIDFIRWNLSIEDMRQFSLSCSYGIGKPNTNGFIEEKKVSANGTVSAGNGILTLHCKGRSLSLRVLNQNIMHILNEDGSMMTGNGGWSYTLNSINTIQTTDINLQPMNTFFKDSIIFEGRTPCRHIEEMMDNRTRQECYKKKWLVRLYRDSPTATTGSYRIGSAEGRTGKWKLKENKEGKIIYTLDLNNGNTLDLLHADENIVYIMDGKGGLLVGDLDFSYSLNRRKK